MQASNIVSSDDELADIDNTLRDSTMKTLLIKNNGLCVVGIFIT